MNIYMAVVKGIPDQLDVQMYTAVKGNPLTCHLLTTAIMPLLLRESLVG